MFKSFIKKIFGIKCDCNAKFTFNSDIKFSKGSTRKLFFPLVEEPKYKTNIVSPCEGNTHCAPPPYPVGSAEFVEELFDVVRVRQEVQRGVWPAWFLTKNKVNPAISEILRAEGLDESNPKGCAQIVHMDDPMDLGKAIRTWAQKMDIPLRKPATHGGKQFRARIVDVLLPLSYYVKTGLKVAFDVKYFYGHPRPEEILNIPGEVFTAYPEGCPAHPEYPAGHGAAAGASYKWFKDTYNYTSEQLKEVETATKQFAMFRTFAGVHYAQANLEGWGLGVRVNG